MFKKQREKTGKENNRNQGHSDPNAETTHWIEELSISNDFVNDYTSSDPTKPFWIFYFRTLIVSESLHRDVVPYLSEHRSLEEVKNYIPVQQIVQSSNSKLIKEKLLQGFAAIRLSEKDTECLLVSVANNKFRDISLPTMEATALGPQAAFVEEIDLSQNEVQYRLVNGQVRIAVICKKLAEEGLFPLLDTFSRSPEIGSLIQLAIVEGEASKLLSIKKYEKENIALYLSDMISQNAKRGELPTTDLAIFSYKYYDGGNDPYLPVLRKENGKIKITGMGLFKDDRLKTTLPLEDVFTLKMLTESSRMGTHQYKVDKNSYVVIKNINVSPRYDVEMHDGVPLFEIKIKVDARIQEYTGHKSNTGKANTLEIQKKIKTIIEKDATKMIKFFQENDVDPLGLGAKYEAHNRDFDLKKWKEQYPDTKVNVHVDLTIVNTGISE